LVMGGYVGTSPNFLKAVKGSDFAQVVGPLFTDLRSQMVKEASDCFVVVAQGVGRASSFQKGSGTSSDKVCCGVCSLVQDKEGLGFRVWHLVRQGVLRRFSPWC
jgi:hypothetical protein